MKTLNLTVFAAILFTLGATFTSCQKDETAGTSSSLTSTAGDAAQSQLVGDEAVSASDDYVPTSVLSKGPQAAPSSIATNDSIGVIIDHPDSVSVRVTLNFGTVGVTGKRGNVLKGTLIVTINKATLTRTIKYSNFSVNDNAIKGYKTVVYGKNSESQPTWTITARDTITRHADGVTVYWNSDRVRTRTSDNGTPLNVWDDVYSVKGTASGVNAKGKAYTMTVDDNNPLVFHANYNHIVKGSLTISSEQKTALLDYGDGTLDDKATVTVNGVTKEITLGK
jgi:hypothetical protein